MIARIEKTDKIIIDLGEIKIETSYVDRVKIPTGYEMRSIICEDRHTYTTEFEVSDIITDCTWRKDEDCDIEYLEI